MNLGSLMFIVLVLMLISAVPVWSHSKNWGYYPSGSVGVVLLILLVLLLLGRI